MHQICWIPLHVTLRYFYMKYFIQAAQQDDTRQCFKPWTPKGPGFVVYIIAPNDDMPLTGLEAQEREVEMKVFRSEFTTPKTLLILTEMVQMAQGRAMCHDWCGVSGLWEIFFGTFHHLPQRCWFLSHPCCSCAKWCDRGLDRQDDLAECDFLKNCGDSQVMFKFRVQSMFSSRNVVILVISASALVALSKQSSLIVIEHEIRNMKARTWTHGRNKYTCGLCTKNTDRPG